MRCWAGSWNEKWQQEERLSLSVAKCSICSRVRMQIKCQLAERVWGSGSMKSSNHLTAGNTLCLCLSVCVCVFLVIAAAHFTVKEIYIAYLIYQGCLGRSTWITWSVSHILRQDAELRDLNQRDQRGNNLFMSRTLIFSIILRYWKIKTPAQNCFNFLWDFLKWCTSSWESDGKTQSRGC